MKAVILAGGLGTRLSEETQLRPKPMVEIGGRPILWHVMKIYDAHGIKDFVICLGYKGFLIKEFFLNYPMHMADMTVELAENKVEVHRARAERWKVTLIDTGENTQTGGRLKRIRPYLSGETFCMTYGDGLSDVDITAEIEFHKQHGKAATALGVAPAGRFGSFVLDGDNVTEFSEKPRDTTARINGGFFVLEPHALDMIDGDRMPWEQEPLKRLAEAGELRCFRHDGFWQPMDTLREKRLLEDLWERGNAPWKLW